ncbi:hypothetical protein PVK06_028024 [Gossypium arboreum]|uniref:Retrovirus-related Pol polyprotein from transposon TNT 1-94 n=1 Tax=Gossypium arboreum TaxID=29729 RepID=A0ABR0P1Y7_GOSAR|nr:hypothetical protein PVK06_028024 [Gossypium arboreum]
MFPFFLRLDFSQIQMALFMPILILTISNSRITSWCHGMDSTIQIWKTLSNLYSSKTTSKLMYYRQALHSQKKGELSMKDFLMKIKMFYDQLERCGEVISEPEHVTTILNGLPPEYESVLTVITSTVQYNVQGISTVLFDAKARK